MNPSYPFHRFSGLGTSFLFPSDIRALQSIYGAGTGSVQPIDLTPEPTTCLLVASGILVVSIKRHRRRICAMR